MSEPHRVSVRVKISWHEALGAIMDFSDHIPTGQISRWEIERLQAASKRLAERMDEADAEAKAVKK